MIAALERGGFTLVRIRGSHHYLRRPGGRVLVTVPVHAGEVLKPKLLKSILKQANLTLEEFKNLLS
ncbi:MAG: type II toxin-antitoxin system HicA family toxin [Bacillota bacterium]